MPIWGAATPARPGTRTLSSKSVTSARMPLSIAPICAQGLFSTGSPNTRIARSAIHTPHPQQTAPGRALPYPLIMLHHRTTLDSSNHNQEVTRFNLLGSRNGNPLHNPRNRRGNGRFHLHCFNGCHALTSHHGFSRHNPKCHHARERRGTLTGLRGIRLLNNTPLHPDASVSHKNRTQLPVQRRHDSAHPPVIRLTNRLQRDVQQHTRSNLHDVLGTRLQAVEVVTRVQHRQVSKEFSTLLELPGRRGEKQGVEDRSA